MGDTVVPAICLRCGDPSTGVVAITYRLPHHPHPRAGYLCALCARATGLTATTVEATDLPTAATSAKPGS